MRTVFCKPVVPVRCGDRKQSGIGICGCSYRSFLSVASVKYVNQEYLARTSGIMSAASIAAMPVLSFIISGLVSFVTTAQCFIFAGVCALLECIWILKNKGIEGNM